jgi:hypothetical protein
LKIISDASRYYFGVAVIAGLITFSLCGCGKEKVDREIWIERGERALSPFKKRLMADLVQGLKEGPEAAIKVCQLVAPEIALEVSSPGVQVGRTSHKLRNRHNAPRKWMQSLLDEYVKMSGKTEPEVVELSDGRIGYVEPIYVKQMCLPCHGRNLSPEVVSLLDEHYPQDEARGFEEGNFRLGRIHRVGMILE